MDNQATIIGISGGSGSGKTTVLNALKKRFNSDQVCLISQDNYYKKREDQEKDAKGVTNFDLPSSIREHDLLEDLKKLQAGESIQFSEYTFNNAQAEVRELVIAPAPVIIMEGLFIYHFADIRDILDVKVFIHAKEVTKIARRIVRDKECRNYPLDDVLYRYQHHVQPSYDKYLMPYIDDCDIVINNNDSFEIGLDILSAYISSKLSIV